MRRLDVSTLAGDARLAHEAGLDDVALVLGVLADACARFNETSNASLADLIDAGVEIELEISWPKEAKVDGR